MKFWRNILYIYIYIYSLWPTILFSVNIVPPIAWVIVSSFSNCSFMRYVIPQRNTPAVLFTIINATILADTGQHVSFLFCRYRSIDRHWVQHLWLYVTLVITPVRAKITSRQETKYPVHECAFNRMLCCAQFTYLITCYTMGNT